MTRTTYDGQEIAAEPPFGASVVVWRHGSAGPEALILHRAHHGPDYSGDWAWTPPAGARRPGEAYEACARRELNEETGLDLPLRAIAEGGDWLVYFARAPRDAHVTLDAEHDRYAWLPLEDACALCRPPHVAEQLRLAYASMTAQSA